MLLYWILLPIVWVLAHILWRFEVIGRDHLKSVQDGRPYVIAANHIANLDPVFILIEVFSWRRLYIPAKEELFKNPLAGWFLHCMGAVSIDRGKGDTVTLERLTESCKNGTGVLIFPEGTRTKTGKLGVLKSGAFVIAGAAGADMVPCRIIYGSKDGKMHLFCKIRIVFGEPIPAAELQVTDASHKIAALRRMKNRLRDDLEQLLAEKKLKIHPFLETGNTDILVRILLHGNCLSFLPQYVVRPYLLSGKMQTVDVEDCRIQMWSQLVYHKNKWVTPQMNCFITLMKEKMSKVI